MSKAPVGQGSIEQWNKIFWTDESKFEIFGGSMCGEELMKELYHTHSKAWRRLCNSMGSFCQLQSREFAPGEGQIDSDQLSQHTAASCDPIWNVLVGQGFVLMQDNDSKQRYIKTKEEQHVLQLISWLMQSADLNSIELVWDELD